ncbi:peptidoglycan-binding domain-containing protein [Prosthecomicrobium sp. N25]|uniref:peptidoglycan-binding domain-containing protein n=1 Tax=Prosthecomicrobium sp. N25 TaxID=3129254 RepID=UPI0030789668
MSILKRGLKGEPVRILQGRLGVPADGDFGPATEKALKAFQSAHGLSADGIAGPDTFAALGLNELVLLRQGSRGETVKKLQQALGLQADGAFGPATRKAVMEFQASKGLEADGMAGPDTLAALPAFASTFTAETVKKAELPPDLRVEIPEPLPPLSGADIAAAGAAASPAAPSEERPPKKSVWATVKGWFG